MSMHAYAHTHHTPMHAHKHTPHTSTCACTYTHTHTSTHHMHTSNTHTHTQVHITCTPQTRRRYVITTCLLSPLPVFHKAVLKGTQLFLTWHCKILVRYHHSYVVWAINKNEVKGWLKHGNEWGSSLDTSF